MKRRLKLSGFALSLGIMTVPFLALAQQISACSGVTTVSNLFEFLCKIQNFLNAVIPFLVALAAVYFVFGVVQYVVASEEEAKKKGRDRMIFGIIGLVVILSVWGLVRIVVATLATPNAGPIGVPCLPGQPC